MAYNELAREVRRCQVRTKDGQPCRRYAVWDDPLRRCAAHGGRVQGCHIREKTAYHPCRCIAYPFPHRPGSGICEWPNPPRFTLRMRPGTHADGAKGRKEVRHLTNRPTVLFFEWLYGPRRHGR